MKNRTAKSIVILCVALGVMGHSPALAAEPGVGPDGLREILRIRVVNDVGGGVSISRDGGGSWLTLGRVLRYTTQVSHRGFTASKWVASGRVAATAVNAIHVKVGYDAEADRGVIFSLLPREFLAPPSGYGSYLSPDSSIYTDLRAGEGIFGGGAAPLVGNRVLLEQQDGSLCAVGEGYVPARGDVLVMVVDRPARYPIAAICENREGGAVSLEYADGSQRLLGWVIRPVRGVGRFAGSKYAAMGRIRAGHAGVVDVSTSPVGFLGAFQIIPVGHALSEEMGLAWRLTQWMIVGPVAEDSPLWEGLAPLFRQHLRPDYLPDDLRNSEWRQRLLSRFLVEADSGRGWRPMSAPRLAPDASVPLPEWANDALDEVQRIRILFPLSSGRGARDNACFPLSGSEEAPGRGDR